MAKSVLDDLLERPETKTEKARQSDSPDYKAIGEDKSKTRQIRLSLRLKDGTIHIIAYSYIMRIICTSNQFASLICTDCIVTVEGRNLEAMSEKLQDEQVRYLEEFNPAKFKPPSENEPFIQSITVEEAFSDSAGSE